MAFNDIRIPRIDDDTFNEIKKSAEKGVRKMHQQALYLIKLGLESEKKSQKKQIK